MCFPRCLHCLCSFCFISLFWYYLDSFLMLRISCTSTLSGSIASGCTVSPSLLRKGLSWVLTQQVFHYVLVIVISAHILPTPSSSLLNLAHFFRFIFYLFLYFFHCCHLFLKIFSVLCSLALIFLLIEFSNSLFQLLFVRTDIFSTALFVCSSPISFILHLFLSSLMCLLFQHITDSV